LFYCTSWTSCVFHLSLLCSWTKHSSFPLKWTTVVSLMTSAHPLIQPILYQWRENTFTKQNTSYHSPSCSEFSMISYYAQGKGQNSLRGLSEKYWVLQYLPLYSRYAPPFGSVSSLFFSLFLQKKKQSFIRSTVPSATSSCSTLSPQFLTQSGT
jgi:hypothetical protein